MAGPWEKYKKAPVSESVEAPVSTGPWSKYKKAPTTEDQGWWGETVDEISSMLPERGAGAKALEEAEARRLGGDKELARKEYAAYRSEDVKRARQEYPEVFAGMSDEDVADALAQKDAAELGVEVATLPMKLGKGVLMTMGKFGLAGATSEAAGQEMAGIPLDEDVWKEGAKGAVLGGIFKKAEDALDYAKGLGKLDEIGKKTEVIVQDSERAKIPPKDYVEYTVQDGIKVKDVIRARENVDLMSDLSEKGGRTGTQKAAEKLKESEALKTAMMDARAPLEKLSGLSTKYLGKPMTQIIGLRQGGLEASRKKAVNEIADEQIKLLEGRKYDIRTPQGVVANKMIQSLKKTKSGNYEEADELAQGVKSKLDKHEKFLPNDFVEEMYSLNRDSQSLRRLSNELANPVEDTTLAAILPVASAFVGGPFSAVGAAAGRAGLGHAVTKTTTDRLSLVEKALKGRLDKSTKAAQGVRKGVPYARGVAENLMDND